MSPRKEETDEDPSWCPYSVSRCDRVDVEKTEMVRSSDEV